ncbi:autotransporter domain-containing protein [Kaistia sp. 32K]|uniref:autotransporter domain-containing protein n=1 Tax=Kaistia sp. 32K TaxID=2795690 RepID=UPI001915C373|nr:autotransporter domain-containing protein [Kaistia sp. 32K]
MADTSWASGEASVSGWRTALLGSAAAGAMILAMGAPAWGACIDDGTTRNCTGDLAGGVSIDETQPITKLTVAAPTGDITPEEGVAGIRFLSNGAVTIDSNTGSFGIHATGEDADGIKLQSFEDGNGNIGDITANHTGKITSDEGFGVWAETDGAISLTTNGDIEAGKDAINLHGTMGGLVTIDVTGDLTSTGGAGIAASTNGSITEKSRGEINAATNGIALQSFETGAVTIDHGGDINALSGHGIYASGNGTVTSTSTGDIHAGSDGIHLEGHGYGSPMILSHTGAITADAGYGVYADALVNVDVRVNGAIDAGGDGIFANSSQGSTTVDHKGGSLIARKGDGIVAKSPNGAVIVTNAGTLQAKGSGIYAESGSGPVTVGQTGSLESFEGKGIYAASGNGNVEITTDGTVTSKLDAVTAQSGGGSAKFTQGGDVTSYEGKGIVVTSGASSATLTGSGAITSKGDAITVSSSTNATVNRTSGAIESTNGTGIKVSAIGGTASVTNSGKITAYQDGIRSESTYGNTINQTGAITASNGAGIWATSGTAAVSVTSNGAIESKLTGIHAKTGSGSVTVAQTGTVTSNAGKGIDAYTPNGAVTIGTGKVVAKLDGITATNESGDDVKITSAGVTSYDGAGILASSATGEITITNNGAVTSQLEGIKATSLGDSTVSIEQNGDLTSYSKTGITAWSATGAINVTGTGAITAELDGIKVGNEGYGKITIDRTGDITAYKGRGIIASSTDGEISVKSAGKLVAETDGIVATNVGSNKVSVTQEGDLTANKGTGIVASSTTGEVVVSSTGTLIADLDGIVATNLGDTKVSVTQNGNLTAYKGTGIVATSTTGEVKVTQTGVLLADLDGIVATNVGETAVTVDAGSITANKGTGIIAQSSLGAIKVTSVGDIFADLDGIIAKNEGTRFVSVSSRNITATNGTGIVATSALGAITVVSAGNITAKADGIYAANASDDGTVSVTHGGGTITTDEGDGIHAETVNADIDVTIDGDIKAARDGIRLTSYGDQTVTIDGGSVQGGAGFAGVNFDGGHLNWLTNNKGGDIRSADGINGLAISAHDSDTTIVNNGTITGNVILSDWTNRFDNGPDGIFNMGDTVHLGAGNTLTNNGVVTIGGDAIATTALNGSFVNGAAGTLKIDVDLAHSTADRLDVSENASLAGSLGLHLTTLGTFGQTFTVLTAENIATNGLTVSNPLVQYQINSDSDHLDLTVAGYDYLAQGLNANGKVLGSYFNSTIGHLPALDPIGLALLNLTTMDDVNNAYNQLSPDAYLNEQMTAVQDSLGFATSMLSCKVRDGAYAFNAEGECAWGRVGYRTFDRETTAENAGFDRTSWELAGGAQYAVKDDVRVGFAVAAGTSKTTGASGATSDGKRLEGGLIVKYVPGPLTLAAAVSGSYGWYDSERSVRFGDFNEALNSKPEAGSLNARLRAAYDLGNDTIYIRPQIEGNATYLYQAAFSETGGVAAVSVDSGSQTVFSVAPEVEVGGQVITAGGTMIRPYVKGGVTAFSSDSFALNARFVADTSNTSDFTVTSSTDRLLWNTSVGVDLLFENGNTVRAFYDGNFGQTSTENAFGLKASHNF